MSTKDREPVATKNNRRTKALAPEVLERELPKWKEPENLDDALERLIAVKGDIERLAMTATERFYESGMLLLYFKRKLGFGNWMPWVKAKVGYSLKTCERYMGHAERCNEAGKLLLYLTDRSKIDTMTILLPPPEDDTKNELALPAPATDMGLRDLCKRAVLVGDRLVAIMKAEILDGTLKLDLDSPETKEAFDLYEEWRFLNPRIDRHLRGLGVERLKQLDPETLQLNFDRIGLSELIPLLVGRIGDRFPTGLDCGAMSIMYWINYSAQQDSGDDEKVTH